MKRPALEQGRVIVLWGTLVSMTGTGCSRGPVFDEKQKTWHLFVLGRDLAT